MAQSEYCSREDVEKRLKDFRVYDIPNETIDNSIIAASNTIDAMLDHYYDVSLFPSPATGILHTICVELAAGRALETVYQDKSDEESRTAETLWDRGTDMLKRIRCNKMDVPGQERLA